MRLRGQQALSKFFTAHGFLELKASVKPILQQLEWFGESPILPLCTIYSETQSPVLRLKLQLIMAHVVRLCPSASEVYLERICSISISTGPTQHKPAMMNASTLCQRVFVPFMTLVVPKLASVFSDQKPEGVKQLVERSFFLANIVVKMEELAKYLLRAGRYYYDVGAFGDLNYFICQFFGKVIEEFRNLLVQLKDFEPLLTVREAEYLKELSHIGENANDQIDFFFRNRYFKKYISECRIPEFTFTEDDHYVERKERRSTGTATSLGELARTPLCPLTMKWSSDPKRSAVRLMARAVSTVLF